MSLEGEKWKTLNFPSPRLRQINLHFHSVMIYYSAFILPLSTPRAKKGASLQHADVCKFISSGTGGRVKTICQTSPQASSIKVYISANNEQMKISDNKWFTNRRKQIIAELWLNDSRGSLLAIAAKNKKKIPIKKQIPIDDSVVQSAVYYCLSSSNCWTECVRWKKMNRGNFSSCLKLATNYTWSVSGSGREKSSSYFYSTLFGVGVRRSFGMEHNYSRFHLNLFYVIYEAACFNIIYALTLVHKY